MTHILPEETSDRLRRPAIGRLTNLRDLGGLEAGAGPTRWRRGLRSEGLHGLHDRDLDALGALGVATVIDLRGARELTLQPNPCAADARFAYVNVPLFEMLSPINLDAMRDGFGLEQRYVEALDTCQGSFAAVFRAIASARPGAVLVHCTAGKDRTGLVVAMWLLLAGVRRAAIVADYLATETQGRPLLDRLKAQNLARGRLPEKVITSFYLCEAPMIDAFIDRLETLGGAAAWLSRAGVTEAELGRVRQRLTV